MTACSTKNPSFSSYQFDEYQGFSAKNDFLTVSDPAARLLAESEQNVLSGNLFDQTAPAKRMASLDDILSENLFALVSVNTKKGGVFDRMLKTAYTQIGTRYRAGGTSPVSGFDCSGFTTWVYSKLGINLPRSSREQIKEGKVIAKSQLRKGDLVFFGNQKRITHVGIYLEDNKFIHSSSSGDTVKISSLDEPIWEKKYTGARRIF